MILFWKVLEKAFKYTCTISCGGRERYKQPLIFENTRRVYASLKDAPSKGCIVQGTHRPQDALAKGCFVQWTKHPIHLWDTPSGDKMTMPGNTLFPKARSTHRGFSHWKMKEDDKKVHSAIGSWFWMFSSRLCQCLYDVKQKAQLELCAPLAIRFLIANYCIRWRGIFKVLSQAEEGADFFSAPLSLINTFQMSLVSAGSISLHGPYL